jgi:hypothetical protein
MDPFPVCRRYIDILRSPRHQLVLIGCVAPWVCFYCFQYFLVMMSLCRILRSFIGYTVFGDIGVFPS